MNPTLTLPRSLRVAIILFIVLGTGFILKTAAVVLVPIALAALVAFVLNPLVVRVRRWGVPQPVAVLGVVGLAALALLVAVVGFSTQLKQLADDIPRHRKIIEQRVLTVKQWTRGGTLERLQRILEGIDEETDAAADGATGRSLAADRSGSQLQQWWEDWTTPWGVERSQAERREPAPPESDESTAADKQESASANSEATFSFWTYSPWYLSALDVIGLIGGVALLATFFLFQQRDLRDRIVNVAGRGAIATTTKAVGDAGDRISRYLFMQFVINSTFGLAVALGLLLADVPYAVLWGVVAAVFRYVPYVGPWVAAILPISVSLMMNEGWWQPAIVIGLFIVLELLSNNVMEPLLYGQSVGLSEIAVILAAIFWAWMWGPVGLVLATPMTVCLVVLGRHIPELRLFDQMLGAAPQLGPHIRFYQRLLAHADEDAQDLAEEYQAEHSPLELSDTVLLPALELAHHDAANGQIDESDLAQIRSALAGVLSELRESAPATKTDADRDLDLDLPAPERPFVLGIVAQSADEETALQIVQHAISDLQCRFEVQSDDLLVSERIGQIKELAPLVVCLSALPPGDVARARQLCRRIRSECPDVKLVVARWSANPDSSRTQQLTSCGADEVVATVTQLHATLRSILQVHRANQARPVASRDSAA